LAGCYGIIITISFYLAYEVRFDFIVPASYQRDRLHYIVPVVVLKLAALFLAGQFGSVMTYFSIPDLLKLVWSTTAASAVLIIFRLPGWPWFLPPRGVLLVDYLACLAALCSIRLGSRIYRERITLGRKSTRLPQVLIAIVGAGDAGASLAGEFVNAPSRGFKPVVFFDDDNRKHGKQIHGIPVAGAPELLNDHERFNGIGKLVIAMPSAPAKRMREVVALATRRGLKVETLPSIEELTSGRVRASRIRPVEVQDLLGRDPVNLDSASIRKMIEDRVVMITGAGGSIGSELCRQIGALNPKRMLMVDHSEGNLFLIEQELNEVGLGSLATPLLGNILDHERMESIFSKYEPKVVFHAAAHKHVYLTERQPTEAICNNVLGTRRLVQLSSAHGVAEFVLISTDKAINPTSVMGATKRLAEIQLQAAQATEREGGTKFIAVRFGNVLGSSGSVIPIFKRQIANGGPVTVTHPNVTRYFMTIPEAVGLVLQSAVLGNGGEIFILDMGDPIKILDLARQMIELSGFTPGDDIEIKITGLKPGEKLFEELLHRNEKHQSTEHPRVMRLVGQYGSHDFPLKEIDDQIHLASPNELKKLLQRLVPEYTPYLD